MLDFAKILIKNDISDRTKFELINKFYIDRDDELVYCIKVGGIANRYKIRMLNLLMKKLIKSKGNEALAISFLILSHESYPVKLKQVVHRFLKIYNDYQIKKHENNQRMLNKILEEFHF